MSASAADFTRDLAYLVRTGMPVDEALDFVGAQSSDSAQQETARDMARRVRNGESLAGAVKARGLTFGGFYGAMIGFGERSESLPEILDRLAEYLDAGQRFKARAREALIYPSAILFVCLCIALFMRQYLFPTFYAIEGISRASHAFDHGAHLIETALAVALVLSALLSLPGAAAIRWRLPFFGVIWRHASYAMACRGMALALAGGSSVPEAVRMAASADAGSPFSAVLREVALRCDRGMSLSEAMRATRGFPVILTESAAAGEQSEQLPKVLMESAALHERLLESDSTTLLTLIEPVALIVVGAIVATLALSFWWPFYDWIGRMMV